MTYEKPPDKAPRAESRTGERAGGNLAAGSLTRRSVLYAAGAAGFAGLSLAGYGVGVEPGCRGGGDGSSPAPGPPVLYAGPAKAPQFQNRGPWEADPLLVSGHDAYVEGEYLFQDFIYDDNGANTTPTADPPEPAPDHHGFGPMTGDVVYPSDAGRSKERKKYLNNAADLLEFRVRLTDDGRVHYRFTLNTMRVADAAAIAVGIDVGGDGDGDGTGNTDWGYGLGDLGAPVDDVLVTWGSGAEYTSDSLQGTVTDEDVDMSVEVSVEHNQIDVILPQKPEGETWRHYLVTGLWNADEGEFKQIANQPTSDQPGGARGQNPPPVFNVGFRNDAQEPVATPNAEPAQAGDQLREAKEEQTASRGVGYGHWREHAQATALADRDISRFHADVDFSKLQSWETRRNVPETGYLDRIYVSHHAIEDENNPAAGIGPYVTEDGDDNNGEDVIRGNLVPYSLFVPDAAGETDANDADDADSGGGMPFHVHLHSLSGTYNQYKSWTPNFLRQIGKQRDTIVMTTTGRGPGVPYDDQAELDVFEAWNDAARHYDIDFDRVTIGGYSMGGIGTHRLASKWPDLFARGFSIAGSLGAKPYDHAFGDDVYKNQRLIAINQRHVPLLIWQGTTDELAPFPLVVRYEQHLRDLGLRHEMDVFPGYDHLAFGYLDEWGPAAEFLGGSTVARSPPRVTYRRVPRLDNENLGLVHDGVYWVSDIEVADGEAHGLVDARSLGFGEADPVVRTFERPGTDPKPHTKRGVEWVDRPERPPRNGLELEIEQVSAVTIWVDEAALDPHQPIELAVRSTGSATITLASSVGDKTVEVDEGRTETTVRLCGRRASRGPLG